MPIPGLNEPFPSRDEIVIMRGDKAGHPTTRLTRYMEEVLLNRLQASPVLAQSITILANENTAVSGELAVNLSGGLYRVDVHTALRVCDPVSNSLQLTIGWTLNGLAYTETFTVLNGIVLGATTTRQSVVFNLQVDANTSVTYAFTYASNTAGVMHWQSALGLTLLGTIGA